MRFAPHAQARLLMLLQWRSGLRISEALHVEVPDIRFSDGDRSTLRVRFGKGGPGPKERIVPLHPELSGTLHSLLAYSNLRRGPLITVGRVTAWRWVQKAVAKARAMGQFSEGRRVGTHTLRHSAARHWLASGVPINVVSR